MKIPELCDVCKSALGDHYHQIEMTFITNVVDPKTKQVEEMTGVSRQTNSIICDSCLERFAGKVQEFVEQT